LTKRQRCSDRAGRGVLRSPGRPSVAQRDERRRLSVAIAWAFKRGARDRDRVFARRGRTIVPGNRRNASITPCTIIAAPVRWYLRVAERKDLAMLRVQGHRVREIARRMARAPSTVSREL
jgi:hypothetical protein